MKKKILIGTLIFAAALGAYFYHLNQAEQKINRTVDQFLDTIAHQKISLRKPSETQESLHKILANTVTFKGQPPIPNEILDIDEILARVAMFHNMTTLCEFSEQDRALKISDSKAQVYRTVTVTGAAGPNTRTQQTWKIIFDLEKQDHWRITAIRGKHIR